MPWQGCRLMIRWFGGWVVCAAGGGRNCVNDSRTAGAKGKQLTTKPIARLAFSKGSWWDDAEPPSKGVLD